MIYHIFDFANILGGILLGTAMLSSQKSIGDAVAKVSNTLAEYKSIIGGIALVLGTFLLVLRPGCAIHDIIGMLAGITLLGAKLNDVPGAGPYLVKVADWFEPHQNYLGIAAIVAGVLGLLNIHILC